MHKQGDEKAYYTIYEVRMRLDLTIDEMQRLIRLHNIETRQLPGSREEHISLSDVQMLEENIRKNDGTVRD